jgi:CRISPR-associated endonuclease Csy4
MTVVTSHYLDLTLQPDPEFGAPLLMAALHAKLHRALVLAERTAPPEQGAGVGVSFPGHDNVRPSLGTCLRLHGSAAALEGLMATPWLQGLRDHLCTPTPAVQAIPEQLQGHRVVSRVQAQSNPERLRRRLMRRHPDEVDAAEAQRRIPDHAMQRLNLPFVPLTSASTGQTFRLFVWHQPVQPLASGGRFNAYGLSQQGATVPWF